MATLYAKTAGGNWSAAATWSNVSAGGGDSSGPPTAADNVIFELLSGNVTIDAASACRSIDMTSGTGSYTGTLTHTAAFTLTIGDATAGAGNVALKFNAGATYTLGDVATSAITFASTSATQQTVSFAGKSAGNLTFGTSGTPDYAITAALAMDATATLTSTFGHLHMDGASDNSGLSHIIGKFVASASNIRTINLGTSSITLSGTGVYWNMSTTSNITLIATSSSITSPGAAGGQTLTFTSGNKSYGSLTLQGACEQSIGVASSSNATFVNLTRNGTSDAAGRNCIQLNLPANASVTVTGTFTVTGESAIKRALVWPASNSVVGRLILRGATKTLSYVNFQDVAFDNGGVSLDLSGITGGSGDAGGNSMLSGGTITFTASTTQFWQSTGSGSFSDVTKWTSRIPLPQDSCIFNNAFSGSPTITDDMLFTGSIDFSSSTGTVTITASYSGTNITGDVLLRSGVTISGNSFYLNSRVPTTQIRCNGATWSAITQTSSGNGGTLTFADSFNIGAALQPRAGKIVVPSGITLGVDSIVSNANNALGMVLINIEGTLNIRSTGTIFSLVNGNTLTTVYGGGTLGITNTSASSKTFAGGGNNYPNIAITGGGAGAVIFTGANTFNSLQVIGGTKSITLPGSTTTTLLTDSGLGNGPNVITFTASAGSATLSKASGRVSWNFISLTNIISTGGATFYAGSNSTDGGGNTGWIFTDPPPIDNASLIMATTGTAVAIGTNVDLYGIIVGSAPTTVTVVGSAATLLVLTTSIIFGAPVALSGPVTATSSGGIFTAQIKKRFVG